jgi:hypothetical protein
VQFHFLLLDRIADQDRARRKASFPGGVFRVEMCRCEEKLLISGRQFAYDPSDGGAVGRSEARIDDEGGSVPHNDCDIGKAHDRPNVLGNFNGIFAEDGLILS